MNRVVKPFFLNACQHNTKELNRIGLEHRLSMLRFNDSFKRYVVRPKLDIYYDTKGCYYQRYLNH